MNDEEFTDLIREMGREIGTTQIETDEPLEVMKWELTDLQRSQLVHKYVAEQARAGLYNVSGMLSESEFRALHMTDLRLVTQPRSGKRDIGQAFADVAGPRRFVSLC